MSGIDQAYSALSIAAAIIGQNNFKSQMAKHVDCGRSKKTFRFSVTPEHRELVEALPAVLSGKISADYAMSLLHQYDTMRQRFVA